MDLYLPIANLSVNALVIIGLGGVVGLLSGMFGVGGGFLTTPLLIFYGIPPTVAAASAASQVTGASVSGVVTHMSRGTVDFRMGGVLIAGGVVGALLEAVPLEEWVVALKGAEPELVRAIQGAMPKRQAQQMESINRRQGPVPLSRVEQVRKDIMAVVREMSASGELQVQLFREQTVE